MTSTKPFSFDTIEDFDDHIAKSIPNYHLLSSAISDLSTFFTRPDTRVVDLGCSTGALLETIPFLGEKIGIDVSENLLPQSHDKVTYLKKDLRAFDTFGVSSFIMSIFTLQFIPPEDRLNILHAVHSSLIEGGAFVWAEKVYEYDGLYERVFNNAYYDFKRKKFSPEEIMDKERDLRQLMTVQTSEHNQELAHQAGFFEGGIFWKFYNFEARLYIK
jgi:tRNA (cmo5U34)-methyltransferase